MAEEPSYGVYQNLRKLINVIDELRDIGLHQYINLPRIVVVGTQSAGKSSVLEGIVGLDFLPRGDGVVTRRPLELRLVHSSTTLGTTAQFEGSDQKFTQMTEVRSEIERLTDSIAGKNKGIVDKPIVLTITGPECPDLTLVDLPGITRVPLRNSDQTDDIEVITREMSRRYVEDPRTIILAVIPANQDISTSDALQLARKVDPRGLRTIGVITKLDLMDQGTNASKMITGEEIPLRLGYIAVKNRSQADITAHKSVRLCGDDETTYFRTHPIYKSMSPHYFGMKNLIDKLTKVLFKHIHNFLPQIKSEISTKQRDLKQRFIELGDGVPTETNQKTQLIWSMINDYCKVFSNVIRGKYDKQLSVYVDPETNALYGGCQIRQIFTDLLKPYMPSHGNAMCMIEMTDYEIDQAIRMHEGDSLPGFPTPDTFEYLMLPHLQKLQFPVIECLDQTAYTLEQLLQHLSARVFARFPQLGVEVMELSRTLLEQKKEKTKEILDYYVSAEIGYMFTNDENYLSAHGAMIASPTTEQQNSGNQAAIASGGVSVMPKSTTSGWFSGKDSTLNQVGNNLYSTLQWKPPSNPAATVQYSTQFLNEIRSRLNAYFTLVLRNIRDTAPKTIGHFLVRSVQNALPYELFTSLSNLPQELLGEPDEIIQERISIKHQLDVLSQASVILQRDPSIASFMTPIDEQFDWDLQNVGKETPSANAQPITVNAPLQGNASFQKLKLNPLNLNQKHRSPFRKLDRGFFNRMMLLRWVPLVGLTYGYKQAGDWLLQQKDAVPFRRIDGRITDSPDDNIPVGLAEPKSVANVPSGLSGAKVTSDHELSEALKCLEQFPNADSCQCRMDVAITTNYFYLCEDTHRDWWRRDGNTILTGGPYPSLTVDRVTLNLVMPWERQDPMLWISLFSDTEETPCLKPFEERNLTLIDSRFDMSQYIYDIYPTSTNLSVPAGWTFAAEPEKRDIGFFYFKDVTTYAHLTRGA